MGAGNRTRGLTDTQIDIIAKIKSKKNARRKARKAKNAQLREAGVKFGHKDACYKHTCPGCKCEVKKLEDVADHAECFCNG